MIFCVEDEAPVRNMIVYTLKAAGFEAEGIDSGSLLWEKLQQRKPQLIMLDLNLPDEDGISILKRLKSNQETENIPVIIASTRSTEYDKVLGLDSGADDYLDKPFGMMEMISRVKAVLRRYESKIHKKTYTLGPLTLDTTNHSVCVNEKLIRLTLKEYELLCLLLQEPGKVYSREDLMRAIWGISAIGETRTVDVHIATLRTKIGPAAPYIETVRGVGYRASEKNSDLH